MGFNSHSFSIEDAISTSQDTYDVDFDAWGYLQVAGGGDPNNVRYPAPGKAAIPTTLAAVSIGPRSTVDRCWISWDRQKNLTLPNDVNAYDFTSQLRPLTIDAPLLYSQATNKGTLVPVTEGTSAAMQRGLLYAFAYDSGVDAPFHSGSSGLNTTILPEKYVDQFGVERFFNAQTGYFEAPFLHLVLGLRSPRFAVPTKRLAYRRTQKISVLLANPKTQMMMVPIFGRKHVSVQMMSYTDGVLLGRTCDFWVGLIRNVNESNVVAPNNTSPVFEAPAGSALATPPSTPISFNLSNPCADYLVVYSTAAVGNASVFVTVCAED